MRLDIPIPFFLGAIFSSSFSVKKSAYSAANKIPSIIRLLPRPNEKSSRAHQSDSYRVGEDGKKTFALFFERKALSRCHGAHQFVPFCWRFPMERTCADTKTF